jgi:hypothetical protein
MCVTKPGYFVSSGFAVVVGPVLDKKLKPHKLSLSGRSRVWAFSVKVCFNPLSTCKAYVLGGSLQRGYQVGSAS